jgi:hypothetical protein
MSIHQYRVKSAEYVRNIFSATPEIGTTFEDILKPEYWAHVAASFHPTDRIEVLAEDGSWFAELFIVSCGKNWAKVCTMRFVELSESVAETPEDAYRVIWRGAVHKHSVVRKSDSAVIKAEFPTAADAKKWLESYESEVVKA